MAVAAKGEEMTPEHEEEVIIVGAGQSGLAAAACLSVRGVASCLVLERDDCVASLWRHRAYDRLRLHLPKRHCALPRAPHAAAAPDYLPRDDFAAYLDAYASRFGVHLVSREVWSVGMALQRYLPTWAVDKVVLLMCAVVFGGDTARYGLRRPAVGPFAMKMTTPAYPVFDVGTFAKIRSGEIRVVPAGIKSVRGGDVEFADGRRHAFDAIVFATGYRSTTKQWLKSDDGLIGDDGMAGRSYPNHWKGENGLYCAGMVRRGIYGSGEDAELIADDISKQMKRRSSEPVHNGHISNGSP
uniref:indole-3-pyruvate monooxygenase n=1 Tax=Oryza barthii TaxID=65489 RepID=A0A0D3EMA2_9ORYZ